MATHKLNKMKMIWQEMNKPAKVRILRSYIFPIATYGYEVWTIRGPTEIVIAYFDRSATGQKWPVRKHCVTQVRPVRSTQPRCFRPYTSNPMSD